MFWPPEGRQIANEDATKSQETYYMCMYQVKKWLYFFLSAPETPGKRIQYTPINLR